MNSPPHLKDNVLIVKENKHSHKACKNTQLTKKEWVLFKNQVEVRKNKKNKYHNNIK